VNVPYEQRVRWETTDEGYRRTNDCSHRVALAEGVAMPKTTDSVIFSEIEREILETALQNPALSNSEIADRTGARLTLVRDTRRTYEDEVELSEAAAEAAEAADAARSPAGVDDADLSETQVAILEALQADPTLSNAEVADRTGARMALVRDTRAEYGEAVTAAETAADDSEDADTDDTTDTADEPSEARLRSSRWLRTIPACRTPRSPTRPVPGLPSFGILCESSIPTS